MAQSLGEKSALGTFSRNNWRQIFKAVDDPMVKKDLSTLLKLREAARLATQVLVEYSTVPSLADYLAADAMVVPVNETLTLSENMPNLQPFTLERLKKNCYVDFLIFINSCRFFNASYDEKLTILAHEAMHVVESARSSEHSSFEATEMKVKKWVSDFKNHVKYYTGCSLIEYQDYSFNLEVIREYDYTNLPKI